MLKKVRVWLAVIVLGCMLGLFANFGAEIGKLSFLAKLQLIPTLLSFNLLLRFNLFVLFFWLILTCLFGRLYCSIICPLGIMQDVFSHWGAKLRGQPKFTFRYPYSKCRYVFLLLYVIAFIFNLGFIVNLLSPYASFGRLATNLANPTAVWLNNMIAPWLATTGSFSISQAQYFVVDWLNFTISVLWGTIIAATAFFFGRLYCNSICPIGTALGLISSQALYRIKIDRDKCIKCGLCARNCKAECIDVKSGSVDNSRCVKCFNCLETCHKEAIGFTCRCRIKQKHYLK